MRGQINKLDRLLPEGLIVDTTWLNENGYYNSLRNKYVASGWLERVARRVYRRPRGELDWQLVVLSLQTLLDYQLVIGGRTALNMQGYEHYVSQAQREVHLYGVTKPPAWLGELKVGVHFVYHNAERLFEHASIYSNKMQKTGDGGLIDQRAGVGFVELPFGHWNWPLRASTPERAILEVIEELPKNESFHQVDMLMEGLTTLRPRHLQRLLEDCRSVKAKRLFFFFADRHRHAWLERINRKTIDLGSGTRSLVKGGRYEPEYKITVPEELYGLR